MLLSVAHHRQGDALSGILANTAHTYDLAWNHVVRMLQWPTTSNASRSRGGAMDILVPGSEATEGLNEYLGIEPKNLRNHVLERYDQTVLDLTLFRSISKTEGTRAALARRDRWALRWAYRGKMPACLACFSERPYLAHISWRLGIQPICLRHGLTLTLTCPHCGGPGYGTVSGRTFRRFPTDTTCVSCGAQIEIENTDQRPATSTELMAARQISDWLETAVTDQDPALCKKLRAVTDWAQALQPVGYRRVLPPPDMIAICLPQALDLTLTGGESIDPGTRRSVVAWRLVAPERRQDLTTQTTDFPHEDPTKWRRWALMSVPDPAPDPKCVPELMPMNVFNTHFADLLHDASSAVDLKLTLIGARRAASLAVLSGLTMKATRRWVHEHGWSQLTLDKLLPLTRDGVALLGREDEYYESLTRATAALASESINYEERARFVDSGRPQFVVSASTGAPDRAVLHWLNEEYACRRDPELHANAHRVREGMAPHMLMLRATKLEKRLDAMCKRTAA